MSSFSIITYKHKGILIRNPGGGYKIIDHPKQETMENGGETEEDNTVMIQAMADPRASRHTLTRLSAVLGMWCSDCGFLAWTPVSSFHSPERRPELQNM